MLIRLTLHFYEFDNLRGEKECMFLYLSGILGVGNQTLDLLVTFPAAVIKCLEEEGVFIFAHSLKGYSSL